jgi:hypothetical protein
MPRFISLCKHRLLDAKNIFAEEVGL